jgi:hypothetical protein
VKKIMTSMLVAAMLAPAALAGTLKVENISAEAKWAAHLDAEALLKSGIAKFILAEAEKKADFLDGIAKVREAFGFDPLKDIRGITMYGKGLGDDQVVVVVDATLDENKLTGMLMGNETYRGHEYGDLTLHQWTDKAKNGKPAKTQFGCFFDKNTLVVAAGLDLLKGAVDVLAGKADSLAKSKALPLLGNPPAGTFLVAAAGQIKIPVEGNKPRAAAIRDLTDLAMNLGEADEVMFLNVTAATKTARRALQLRQIVQGFVALGQMALQEREDIPPLGEKIDITGEDNVARLSATMPTESVIRVVKFLIAQDARKKAATRD